VIATDNGSVDGTREILADYARSGLVTVLDEPSDLYLQDVWTTRMAHLAQDRFGPCRILPNDADEFWVPPGGSLKRALRGAPDTPLRCRRRNLITGHDWLEFGPWHRSLVFTPVDPPRMPMLRQGAADRLARPLFCHAVPDKLLLHSAGLRHVERGAHAAAYDRPAEPAESAIVVYHYPLRAVAEFEVSLGRIAAAMTRRGETHLKYSQKYRRWAEIRARDGMAAVLADALPSGAALNAGLAQGQMRRCLDLVPALDRIAARTGAARAALPSGGPQAGPTPDIPAPGREGA
jgi:hypothetical protein